MVQKVVANPVLEQINADPLLRTRRERLQDLVRQYGGPSGLKRALGYENASFVVQMAGPTPSRKVTEKTAREVEVRLNLPTGWMDGREVPVPVSQPVQVEENLVIETATAVHAACAELSVALPPDKFRNIVTLAYSDAVANGIPRANHIKQLIQLAT